LYLSPQTGHSHNHVDFTFLQTAVPRDFMDRNPAFRHGHDLIPDIGPDGSGSTNTGRDSRRLKIQF
jgi:hypothetical protein